MLFTRHARRHHLAGRPRRSPRAPIFRLDSRRFGPLLSSSSWRQRTIANHFSDPAPRQKSAILRSLRMTASIRHRLSPGQGRKRKRTFGGWRPHHFRCAVRRRKLCGLFCRLRGILARIRARATTSFPPLRAGTSAGCFDRPRGLPSLGVEYQNLIARGEAGRQRRGNPRLASQTGRNHQKREMEIWNEFMRSAAGTTTSRRALTRRQKGERTCRARRYSDDVQLQRRRQGRPSHPERRA